VSAGLPQAQVLMSIGPPRYPQIPECHYREQQPRFDHLFAPSPCFNSDQIADCDAVVPVK
jgi:hypothetical protein